MALLDKATEEKKFDVRMWERNIRRGVFRLDDYEGSLKALSDDAEQADWIGFDAIVEDQGGPSRG